MADTASWKGQSGKSYTYGIFPLPTSFKAEPGNYIFAKIVSGAWRSVYIGQTEDLSERFDNHHAMPCIKRNLATHVHAHLNNNGKQARLDEETDLVRGHDPTCNK